MSLTPSTMQELGKPAPNFTLPDPDGNTVNLADFAQSPVLMVVFMCNHCPYVKHVRDKFLEIVREYEPKGVATVAINSNDVANYPEDSPERMKEEAQTHQYPFPYLYDETQEVAKAYGAACTPDFFVFDSDRKLVYRGQMDGSRPENGKPVNGEDLKAALDAALTGKTPPSPQLPSMGCNIKWKPGNEPEYA